MTDRLEHHLAAEHELDRFAQLPRRRDRERTVGPWPQLAAETGAEKLGDDAHILFRQAEHLRQHAAQVDDALRLFVDRQLVAVPDRGRRLQLDWVVRFGRRDVSLVELDRRVGEGAVGDRRARFAGASPGRSWSSTSSGSSSASRWSRRSASLSRR